MSCGFFFFEWLKPHARHLRLEAHRGRGGSCSQTNLLTVYTTFLREQRPCLVQAESSSLVHMDLDLIIYQLVEDSPQTCDFIVLLYDQDTTSCLVVEDLEFGLIGDFPSSFLSPK